MKKLFYKLCAVLMAFCMLFCAACASKEEPSAPQDPPASEEQVSGSGEQQGESGPGEQGESGSSGGDGSGEQGGSAESSGSESGSAGSTGGEQQGETGPANKEIKNIILMIGDGMGPVHEEAGRIKKGGALAWDDFDHTGLVHTRSLTTRDDPTIPTDSAAAATAMATGQKVINSYVARNSADSDLQNIMELAHSLGKSTGVVTSDQLAGATPSGFSAHASERHQGPAIITSQTKCQLDLLIGEDGCEDGDSNVTGCYNERKGEFTAKGFNFVTTVDALKQNAYPSRVVGAFSSIEPASQKSDAVRLPELTRYALDYLSNDEDGFCLMIEGAKIDKRSHGRDMSGMLNELIDFDECVGIVEQFVRERGDTYLMVTADHATGGLVLKDALNQANISRPTSYEWTEPDHPTCGNHSRDDVHYYALGAQSVHHVDVIENVTIYRIMREFLTGVATPGSDVLDSEIRVDGIAYFPDGMPDKISIGGGTMEFSYDAADDTVSVTMTDVNYSGVNYPIYSWKQDINITLVGDNSFSRTTGNRCLKFDGCNVTVDGTGSLNINKDLYVYGKYTQNGGAVTVGGSGSQDAVYITGEININGGKLEISRSADTANKAIKTYGLNVNGGELKVTGFKYNIYAVGNVNINGGTVMLRGASEAAIGTRETGTTDSGNLVINGGTLDIESDAYGLFFGGDTEAADCRIDVFYKPAADAVAPKVKISSAWGAIRAYNMDIYGGDIDITITGYADAVKIYNWMIFQNAVMKLKDAGPSTKTGLHVNGKTVQVKSGTIVIDSFDCGVAKGAGGTFTVLPGATVTYLNCNKQVG